MALTEQGCRIRKHLLTEIVKKSEEKRNVKGGHSEWLIGSLCFR